jgi:4-hydroxy-3-methylbut-2-en-1-yl diphosphate reductase
MEVILAQPRGFCAGVERAIEIVERALKIYGAPIYVRHEIVHNKYVVQNLRDKGVIFVNEVTEIPDGAITIFSAHGVSDDVENSAKTRSLPIIDATCPLVTKVHKEAQRNESDGRQIILIGHSGHPEVEGTSGRVKGDVLLVENIEDVAKLNVSNPLKLAYVTQTTLSVDDTSEIISALIERFPEIKGPGTKDICYATQNRQSAVHELAVKVDLLLVIGSSNSSNSNRLCEIGKEHNIPSYLINGVEEIESDWFCGVSIVGITAGASAPETLTMAVTGYLEEKYSAKISVMDGIEENIKFKLPAGVLGGGDSKALI